MSHVLKISEAASLGIHAMLILARDPSKTSSAGEISRVMDVSEAHLAKVLQRLVRVELVKSTRGPKGGFSLGKPADQISLLEIYEAIEGKLAEVKCLLHKPVCKKAECVFGDLIQQINRQVCEHLTKTKLSTQQD